MTSAPPPYGWLTLRAMSMRLGVRRLWLANRVAHSPHLPIVATAKNKLQFEYYSPECFKWARAEVAGLKHTPKLGRHLSLHQAAERLGITSRHLEKLCVEHGLTIEQRRSPNNRIVHCIAPTAVKQLQDLLPPLAPADMYNVHQLRVATGWPAAYVQRKLRLAGLTAIPYRSGGNGQVSDYYPAEAKQILGIRNMDYPPAGSWLTATHMEQVLGRTSDWMKPRLARYALVSRQMLGDSGAVHRHYPPSVLHELTRLSDEQRTATKSTSSVA